MRIVGDRASKERGGARVSQPENDRPAKALEEENARLRRELLRRRTHSPMWPIVGGLAAHVLLRPFLDPWLNASSDAKVAAAAVILAVPIVFAIFMLVRALRHRQG